MKKLPLLVLVLLLTIPLASADSNSTSTWDMLRQAFAYAFDDVLKLQAENIYNMSSYNSSALLPDSLTKPRIDILRSGFLHQYSDMMAFIYQWGLILYILGGGAIVVLSNAKPSAARQLHLISFVDKNILDIENFFKNIVVGLLIWMFADRGIEMLFTLEGLLKSFITNSIIVVPPPLPTVGFAYLLDSLAGLGLAAYGVYSYLIVGIVLSVRYALFIAVIFPKIGEVAVSILTYAVVLLFSSVLLTLLAFIGVAIVQSSFIGVFISYFVLDFMLVIGCFVIVISPILYKWLFPAYRTIKVII